MPSPCHVTCTRCLRLTLTYVRSPLGLMPGQFTCAKHLIPPRAVPLALHAVARATLCPLLNKISFDGFDRLSMRQDFCGRIAITALCIAMCTRGSDQASRPLLSDQRSQAACTALSCICDVSHFLWEPRHPLSGMLPRANVPNTSRVPHSCCCWLRTVMLGNLAPQCAA